MDGLMVFVIIVIIAFGILQIILFFKVWNMTDNVKLIRKEIDNKNLLSTACVSFIKGDLEEAERLANESFLYEVSKLSSLKDKSEWVEWDMEYWKLVKKYTNIFKKLDRPHPDFEIYKNKDMYLI